jgi:uncharacterized protein YlxP (DUF503 family)
LGSHREPEVPMSAPGGYVCVLVIELHFGDVESLKGRRRELAPVKTFLHSKLGMAVAETGHQDKWQRARLTAALTSGSPAVLEEAADAAGRWLDARFPDGVGVRRTIVSVAELDG